MVFLVYDGGYSCLKSAMLGHVLAQSLTNTRKNHAFVQV